MGDAGGQRDRIPAARLPYRLALYHGFPETPKVVLGTGFCGTYTTFSTFTFETVRLVEEGALDQAVANAFGTLMAGAAAAAVGMAVAAR